jgi:5-keto-L-gluconate epimerase
MKFALTASPGSPPLVPIVWQGSMLEAMAVAADLDYDGVEWHLRRATEVDPGVLAEHMARHGLATPTLGTGMAASQDGLTFADPDAEVRRQAVDRVLEHVRLAARLRSAVTVGSVWGKVGKDPQTRGRLLDLALHCLATCCAAGQAEGVPILLEPLNRYESDYPQTLAQGIEIIAQSGAENLRLLADTFHMNVEEVDVTGSLRDAAPWLGHIHLADSNRQAPGHGHLDVDAVLAALDEIDYAGFVSFEILPLPTPRRAAEDAACAAHAWLSRHQSRLEK